MQQQLVERRDELIRIVARASHAARSIDVPVGLFGGSAGMVAKIILLTKLSRRKEVSEEKIANCGPSTLASPGTRVVDG